MENEILAGLKAARIDLFSLERGVSAAGKHVNPQSLRLLTASKMTAAGMA